MYDNFPSCMGGGNMRTQSIGNANVLIKEIMPSSEGG
jgi:hypothetical protein